MTDEAAGEKMELAYRKAEKEDANLLMDRDVVAVNYHVNFVAKRI